MPKNNFLKIQFKRMNFLLSGTNGAVDLTKRAKTFTSRKFRRSGEKTSFRSFGLTAPYSILCLQRLALKLKAFLS